MTLFNRSLERHDKNALSSHYVAGTLLPAVTESAFVWTRVWGRLNRSGFTSLPPDVRAARNHGLIFEQIREWA